MNLLGPVGEIASKELITLSANDYMIDVKNIFEKHRINHIPIVKAGELVGMVSKSDYLYFCRRNEEDVQEDQDNEIRFKVYKVEDVMTTKLATLEYDEKLNVALEIFKENLFHAIPIMKNKALYGILTTYDIIHHLATDRELKSEYINP